MVGVPGMKISPCVAEEQGVQCICLDFHLPEVHHSSGMSSFPVLVPSERLRTGFYQPMDIFNSLLEEIILWLARFRPRHSLIQLHERSNSKTLDNSNLPLPCRNLLHSAFASYVNSLREPVASFPLFGQTSSTYGDIELALEGTFDEEHKGCHRLSLTLPNRDRISWCCPIEITYLTTDLLLDWLEIQNMFYNSDRCPIATVSTLGLELGMSQVRSSV